jgi:hypothetical protein
MFLEGWSFFVPSTLSDILDHGVCLTRIEALVAPRVVSYLTVKKGLDYYSGSMF